MKIMRKLFNERNLVVILFVMVMVAFSLAQKESEKMDKIFYSFKFKAASPYVSVESKGRTMAAAGKEIFLKNSFEDLKK